MGIRSGCAFLLGAFGTVVFRKRKESATAHGETLAEQLVEPEPEDSFQFGVWLSQNAPTYVAVFTFALAFVTGIIWVTLKSTGEETYRVLCTGSSASIWRYFS